MANLKVERRTAVTGDGLKEPVLLSGIVTSTCGVEFFPCRTTNTGLLRVCGAKRESKLRPAAAATVFETIRSLRAVACDKAPNVLMDLDLDGDNQQPCKRARAAVVNEPEFVIIDLPPVGCVAGVKAKVMTPSGRKLFLECSTEVINWMVAAFAAEPVPSEGGDEGCGEEECEGKCDAEWCEDEVDTCQLPKYVTYDKATKRYKVRFRKANKVFSFSMCEDPLGAAKAYLTSLQTASADIASGPPN